MNTATKILQAAVKGLKKEWPKIATGLGAGLLVTGGYLIGREVPKYKAEIEKLECEKKARAAEKTGEDEESEPEDVKLTFKEKAFVAVKHFAAPVGTILSGGGLLIASIVENDRRISLGTTAAALSELATKNFATYKDAVKEVVSEDGLKEIEKKVTEKKLEDAHLEPAPLDIIPEGKVLCYDLAFGKTPFYTDYNTLKAVENEITSRVLAGGYGTKVSLNEMYELLGEDTTINGEALGWVFDDRESHRMADLCVSTALMNGQAVFTICPNVVEIDPEYFSKPTYHRY